MPLHACKEFQSSDVYHQLFLYQHFSYSQYEYHDIYKIIVYTKLLYTQQTGMHVKNC